MEALYWLILFIILLVIEIITLGLTTIWFAIGALVAFIASMTGAGLGIQLILFFLVSVLLFIGTRPVAVRYLNSNRTKTNVESLINQTALVLETIDNRKRQGLVVVNGQEWTARTSADEVIIEKDSMVTIRDVSGVKLIVEAKKEENISCNI